MPCGHTGTGHPPLPATVDSARPRGKSTGQPHPRGRLQSRDARWPDACPKGRVGVMPFVSRWHHFRHRPSERGAGSGFDDHWHIAQGSGTRISLIRDGICYSRRAASLQVASPHQKASVVVTLHLIIRIGDGNGILYKGTWAGMVLQPSLALAFSSWY